MNAGRANVKNDISAYFSHRRRKRGAGKSAGAFPRGAPQARQGFGARRGEPRRKALHQAPVRATSARVPITRAPRARCPPPKRAAHLRPTITRHTRPRAAFFAPDLHFCDPHDKLKKIIISGACAGGCLKTVIFQQFAHKPTTFQKKLLPTLGEMYPVRSCLHILPDASLHVGSRFLVGPVSECLGAFGSFFSIPRFPAQLRTVTTLFSPFHHPAPIPCVGRNVVYFSSSSPCM